MEEPYKEVFQLRIAAFRMTTLQKPWKVYMICSLYASVQGIENSLLSSQILLELKSSMLILYLSRVGGTGEKKYHLDISA